MKIIDQRMHHNDNEDELLILYGFIPLKKRRKLHTCAIMFRQSKDAENMDNYMPNINLRNRNKLKFKQLFTSLTKVLNSPFYIGVKLWDRLKDRHQWLATLYVKRLYFWVYTRYINKQYIKSDETM